MREKCEAEFIQVGDNTLFGVVTRVSTWQGITRLEFANAEPMEFDSYTELTFWKDED